MSLFLPPDDIRDLFSRPGGLWTWDDRTTVKAWLNEDTQRDQLLRFSRKNLGPGSTRHDAEDAWGSFQVPRASRVAGSRRPQVPPLDYTIHTYDPERGRWFPAWLLLHLAQHCWKLARLRQRRAEVPMVRDDGDGETMVREPPDPRGKTEDDLVDDLDIEGLSPELHDCLKRFDSTGKGRRPHDLLPRDDRQGDCRGTWNQRGER